MPIQTVWTLALHNLLAAAPAYDKTLAVFPIGGDRVVAYDLPTGTQQWIVSARPQTDPVAGDGLVFLVESDSLTARRGADGSVAWQLPFADTLAVHPVWDNGWLVAATTSGSIRAFRASDGQLMAVPLAGEKALTIGTAVPLLKARMLNGPATAQGFRVQGADLFVCTADLERTAALEILSLQEHRSARLDVERP